MRHDGGEKRGVPAFGDAVIARASFDGGEEGAEPPIGLVAETRCTDCRVLYPESGRGAWCDLAALRRAPASRCAGTIAGRVSALLAMLGAHEMSLARIAPGTWRLVAGHGPMGPDTVDAVRESLGSDLVRYLMRPGSMRRIETILEFRFESPADPPRGGSIRSHRGRTPG